MSKRYWRIRGHKGFDTFFDAMIPVGSITDEQLQGLLMCLAAKGNLSYDEIVGAYVKRKTRLAHDILHMQKNGNAPGYWCGHDPSFVAIVVDEQGERVKYPSLG